MAINYINKSTLQGNIYNNIQATNTVRERVDVGLVAMVSFSIVNRSGWQEFIDRFVEAGIDGFIIPDIDEKDANRVGKYCRGRGVSFSMLVAPTTPIDRIRRLAEYSSGFLYVLARAGLTGVQSDLQDVDTRIDSIREVTDLPLAVGFGISDADQVAKVQSIADAAIVGSALVRKMEDADCPASAAAQFVTDISS